MDKLNKIKRKLFMAAVFMSSVASGTAFAFAGDDSMQQGIDKIFYLLKAIATPLAAVGLAFCGFKFFTGGEREMSKVKKTAVLILVSIAMIYLLPALIRLGRSAVGGHQWQPPAPGSGTSGIGN